MPDSGHLLSLLPLPSGHYVSRAQDTHQYNRLAESEKEKEREREIQFESKALPNKMTPPQPSMVLVAQIYSVVTTP